MRHDNFSSDEERRQYLADLARLKKIREAERERQNNSYGIDTKHKKRKKKGWFLRIILIVMLIAVCYFAYSFFKRQTGYYTVAVFGVDARDGNVGKGALSDVNMICNVNMETGEIQLVSVYRDLYSQINDDGKYHKFNEAYFLGGPEDGIATMERMTDVKIDDYATFNWKAVADAINILGGVDIEITDAEFKYLNSFITFTVEGTGIPSQHLEHAGMNHLDGVQAVSYARLRLMDTDFKRTERQRKVVSLAFEKAKNADYATLYQLVTVVLPQINTSVTIDDLAPFIKDIKKYHLGATTGFPFEKTGKNIGRLDCVVPVTLRSNVIALHELLFGIENYKPSGRLEQINTKIINDTGVGGDGKVTPSIDEKSSGGSNNTTNNNQSPVEPEVPEQTSADSQDDEELIETSSETESSTEETIESTEIESTTKDLETSTKESSSSKKEETESTKPASTGDNTKPSDDASVEGPGATKEAPIETPPETTHEVGPGVPSE